MEFHSTLLVLYQPQILIQLKLPANSEMKRSVPALAALGF